MSKIPMPEPDLDWRGDALDLCVKAGPVVAFRRRGGAIVFGINNTVVPLTADEAEEIATNLYAAAVAAREAAP